MKHFSTFLLWFGVLGVIIGIGRWDAMQILFYLCMVGIGIYMRNKNGSSSDSKVGNPSPPPEVITTFSCEAVGFRFPCRFPYGGLKKRKDVLYRSRVGDRVLLKEYEWEGKTAYAIIHQKMCADIGTIPAIHVEKIHELLSLYKYEAVIICLQDLEYRNDFYQKADIQIRFYKNKS